MTAPLLFTKSLGGQTSTCTLTPLGEKEIEFRLSVNGREIPDDTDVAEFDTTILRDEALAGLVELYESNGYTRIEETR